MSETRYAQPATVGPYTWVPRSWGNHRFRLYLPVRPVIARVNSIALAMLALG